MKRLAVSMCLLALTQAAWSQASDFSRIARSAPPDASVLIVVEQAATLRQSPSNEPLSALIEALLPSTTTTHAWSSLASLLGLSPQEGFDALLGDRAMFIGRRRANGTLDWAIETEIEADLARKLLFKLDAHPRDIRDNQAIARLEEGRFQLTYRRRGDGATLVFAPTASELLFNDLLARLSGKDAGSLADTPEFTRAVEKSCGDGDAFVFLRLKNDARQWIAATADVGRKSVDIRFSARLEDDQRPHGAPWTLSQWRKFSDGALLAFVEPIDGEELPLAWLSSRFGMQSFPKFLMDSLDGRIALGLFASASGELAVTAAMGTSDVDRLAPLGDALVAKVASIFAGASDETFDLLEGAFPQTPRSIAFGQPHNNPDTTQSATPLRGPFGGPPSRLYWSYPAIEGPADRRGWWILANRRAFHHRTVAALTTGRGADRPGIEPAPDSYFTAQPAALLDQLLRSGVLTKVGLPSSIRALSRIARLDGRTTTRDGLRRGVLLLTLKTTTESH